MDSKELRKELGLPMTKELRYYAKEKDVWIESCVLGYEIVDTYMPSGTQSLLIELEDKSLVRILADYFVDMQKTTFLSDISGNAESKVVIKNQKLVSQNNSKNVQMNKPGKRVEAGALTYTVLDLETTGFNHNKDEIIEIGAIKYNNRIELDRLSLLIKPRKKISRSIELLTGITNQMLELEGIDIVTAIFMLKEFLGDSVLVGHNISTFDSKFLDDAYQMVLHCHFPNDFIDTLCHAKKVLPTLEHYKLENLAEMYGIDYSNAHRAIEDCVINHLVYEKLVFGNVLDIENYKEYLLEDKQIESVSEIIDTNDYVEISEEEYVGWKEELQKELEKIILEQKLPDNSLGLRKNKKSYSLCIYEPDLIEGKRSVDRYTVIIGIEEEFLKSKPDLLKLELKNKVLSSLEIPIDAEVVSTHIRINKNSCNLIQYLSLCTKCALDNYTSNTGSFACCARYEECSEAKVCIHPNRLYSTACAYRKNLESGKIFYGNNKNIE